MGRAMVAKVRVVSRLGVPYEVQVYFSTQIAQCGTRTQHGCMHMAGRRQLLFLTTRSDDSKPYMIRVALVKGFQQKNVEPV